MVFGVNLIPFFDGKKDGAGACWMNLFVSLSLLGGGGGIINEKAVFHSIRNIKSYPYSHRAHLTYGIPKVAKLCLCLVTC